MDGYFLTDEDHKRILLKIVTDAGSDGIEDSELKRKFNSICEALNQCLLDGQIYRLFADEKIEVNWDDESESMMLCATDKMSE